MIKEIRIQMFKNKKIIFIPILGFLILILIGTILLQLPISNTRPIKYIDALFTSVTSVCTTGFTTVTIADQFTLFGQVIILLLTQIGALGLVIFIAFLFILLNKRINISSVVFFSENINSENYSELQKKIKQILRYTFAIEGIGTWFLALYFVPKYGFAKGLWYSIFHSVTAFCNAGIDLFGSNSLVQFKDNLYVTYIFMVLILLGGLGFFVLQDIFDCLSHGRLKKLSLQSKIVISSTTILTIISLIFIRILEPAISWHESFFASITLRTAGFYITDFSNYSLPIQILSMILMFIGAAPGSTSGGIKLVTFTVIVLTIRSTLSGKENVNVFYKKISPKTIRMSFTIAVLSLTVVFAGIILFAKYDNFGLSEISFQCVSAFSNTGVGLFDNKDLNSIGKLITIALMFLGKIGTISFFTLMSGKSKDKNLEYVEGKLIL